jgi:polyol transport system permease protein
MRAARGTRLDVGERRSVSVLLGILAWAAGLIFFFPVFWMVLSSFKSEQDANGPPKLFFHPTLDRYRDVMGGTEGLLSFSTAAMHSATVVLLSTALVLAMAIPAAYALAIDQIPRWRDVLFFFISTKFLPIVASILPIWIIASTFHQLNTVTVLIVLYTALNLPLAIWMLRSFFMEIPRELIEASEIYAIQLNPIGGSTVPIWVTDQVSTRGNFLAKLSAASVLACIPVVLAGWLAQKRMIRGLAMGAIK